MSDWSEGYVTDIDYTYGYYPELNPVRLRYALTEAGWAAPTIRTACELGFGQGISINMHAAAGEASWFGTDFNPGQVNFARHLAAGSGAPLQLFDDSFAEFAAREDLPNFDYIGLHGIWSWIDDRNRSVIVDFIRRKLNVGGVLYISYNTLPGWAAMVPVRDLLSSYNDIMGAQGQGILSRIDQSLAFADRLFQTNPAFLLANPAVGKKLEALKGQNRNYLAHEYFNRNWLPMSFSRMAEWLAPAKLSYACSAHFFDLIDTINLTAPQQELLADISDPVFRQTVREFMINQQFRKDYWIRGPRRLTPLEQKETLRSQRVVMAVPRQNVSLKLSSLVGEVKLQDDVYNPVLDALADHKPQSLGQLEDSLSGPSLPFSLIREAALILSGAAHLTPAQDEGVISRVAGQTRKLNETLWLKARSGAEHNSLASPVTGGGVVVDGMPQLFLSAMSQGLETPDEWARHAWQILAAQGKLLTKEGQPLHTEAENLEQLSTMAKATHQKLPIYKALGLI